jgi:Reverse transcriptase (RNA-dependent DNA polymerase)
MASGNIEWLEVLDFGLALKNCHDDLIGEWHRDPWSWPELSWAVKRRPELLVSRLNSSGVRMASAIDVAKENFGMRPALIMDPLDRLAYQAITDRLSLSLIRDLPAWVYIARLSRRTPKKGEYVSDREWGFYRTRLKGLAIRYEFLLTTDVVSFFGSIPIDRLSERILQRVGSDRVTDRLLSMLAGWDAIPNRSGLPQRFLASSVLANMYLGPVDDVLRRFGRSRRGLPFRVARWMDDLWLFGNNEGRLRHAQVEISEAMRSIGLEMNISKTKLLEGDKAESEVQQREHSAVDVALQLDEPDYLPLDMLITSVLEAPEIAERTTIRFVTRRMRQAEQFDRVAEFAEVAERMPHAADILARLFRDSGAWADLADWFVGYASSEWAVSEWSVAQFATMFPANASAPRNIFNFFAEELVGDSTIPMLAVAAQRLAAWDANEARVLIRERSERAAHPQERRILALAGIAAEDEPGFARNVLSEFEENSATLQMLKSRKFRALPAAPDFVGG